MTVQDIFNRPFVKAIQNNGGEVFICGGFVRDYLLDLNPKDIDLVTRLMSLNDLEFILSLYDGCGCLLEEWHLEEAYFSYIDFEEIDHSCTDDPYVIYTIKFFNCRYINKFENVPMSNKIGTLNENNTNNNVTCPNCKHEFKHFSFPLNNIIY